MITKLFLFFCGCVFFLSSFITKPNDEKQPKTITRTTMLVNGKEVKKTIILLDGNTSREDLIYTCNFLANEKVQLTFNKLAIGKSFLGLIGKQRIRIAEGKIELPDGSSSSFKAGGATSFKFIKIQYLSKVSAESSQLEMIEIID
ncbi:MAG TPA: hypothetical protein VM888_01525 [Chitinophagaceae bacterium]|nr:hypothetical protein [Chitinophagaceae bacterium]